MKVNEHYTSGFRAARRTTPTAILLHLCVALILLLMTTEVTNTLGEDYVGCRVGNLFTYYFVMVTLAWNAVEAVNMYMMLVRVFGNEIQRFVTKAAVAAWGKGAQPIDHR